MPLYLYKCEDCGISGEDQCMMSDMKISILCKCSGIMWRDLRAEHTTRHSGDYHHISDSLAINPCQTRVHRKLFPDVGVLPDGRLDFRSVKSQSDYCEKTGFEKMPQKIKNKGKQIA